MEKTKIHLIVATAQNLAIGREGKMPWSLKDDLRFFKKTTLHHIIIMGRKTFESIGKALPKRENWILSRKKDFEAEGALVFSSIENVLNEIKQRQAPKVFIIGGGQIYKEFIEKADFMHITKVEASLEADTFFPQWDEKEWDLVEKISFQKNENNEYNFEVWNMKRKIKL